MLPLFQRPRTKPSQESDGGCPFLNSTALITLILGVLIRQVLVLQALHCLYLEAPWHLGEGGYNRHSPEARLSPKKEQTHPPPILQMSREARKKGVMQCNYSVKKMIQPPFRPSAIL